MGRSSDAAPQVLHDSDGARLPESDRYPGPNDEKMDEDEAYEQVSKMLEEMPEPSSGAAEASEGNPDGDMHLGLLANIQDEYVKYGCHVGEVFSPPRVNVIAKKIGLRPGFSLDLNVNDPEDNKPWAMGL